MKGIYDHDKLCLHKKSAIPINIKLGEMINELLNGVNPRLLKTVVSSLKKEYLTEHNDILDTKEKKDHVQMVLDRIGAQKYNFAKQNIEEGEKFNAFYQEDPIKLPAQERNFRCVYCKERSFKTNASLYSHYRSCPQKPQNCQEKKIESLNDENEIRHERKEGFRPIRIKEPKETEQRPNKIALVEIIRRQNEDQDFRENKERDTIYKRQRPVSTYSFGSNIFEDE